MIQSMTGYSRATRRLARGSVTIQLRSTNHRYMEINQRLPEGLIGFEGQIAQLIRGQLTRGRIDVTVAVHASHPSARRVVVDEALARAYHKRLMELTRRFRLKGGVGLDHLLALPLVSVAEDHATTQTPWPALRQALSEALQGLIAMRRREGARLITDLQAQLRLIRKRLAAIRARLPKSLVQQQRRLRDRFKHVWGESASVTTGQIQEALALIKDIDIHEELIRLDSHLVHLGQTLGSREPLGKKVDFISQELMREVNTMGAKANDALIARHVVEIKGAIEKIREQAQNLE